MLMCGNISLISLTLSQLPQSLKIKFSVFMEVCRQALTLLNKSNNLTEFKRYLMKDQCVISSGQILMIDAVGVFLREELATLLDKTFQNSLIIQIT